MLSTLSKFSAEDTLKYFSYFSQETGFDISCKLSLIFRQEIRKMLCEYPLLSEALPVCYTIFALSISSKS